MATSRRKFISTSLKAAGLAAAGIGSTVPAGNPFPSFLQGGSSNDTEAFMISIFSKHLQWLDYDGMASALEETGFDGVDLTVRPGGHVLPERVEQDLPKAAEAVARKNRKIFMLTTAIDNADDPLTTRILKTASSLGIKHYRMGWGHYDDKLSVEENVRSMQSKLASLATLNEKYSISGEYQNHSGVAREGIYFGGAIWDIAGVLKEINSPFLGSQYDVYHATIEGANTWPVGLKLISPFIRSIDIKDFRWFDVNGKSRAEAVPLGEGIVNFTRYFSFLKESQLKIPVSLHFEYPLGGAENGASRLTIGRNEVISAMRKDLSTLKEMLRSAGLV